jgi:hypothetical protein
VAGACPDCGLIPIRMDMNGYSLDSIAIESFEWAADAGAEIISNSWGPEDNAGSVDMNQTLKDLVHTLSTTGRNGKGIIILFAAGNGDESIETDGFASNDDVFAIGATNASGARCSYSDYGNSLDFMVPSADISYESYEYFDGIYTTDNTSGGYVPGELGGSSNGKYAFEFAGTSSACPLAAGITGLVLAANKNLTRDEVYDIFKTTADKTGPESYDSNGFNSYYGYGRINACEAVRKALEMGGTDILNLLCSVDPVDMEVSDDGPIIPDDETTIDEDPEVDIDIIDENNQPDNESADETTDENVPDSENNDGSVENDSDSAEKNDSDLSEISDENSRKLDVGCSCSFVNI